MKATSVPLSPRTSASDHVLPSTPLSAKSRAIQPKSQMPVRAIAKSAILHDERQSFCRAGDPRVKPALTALRKSERFVEQRDVVPLRALRLVDREHVTEVEFLVALAVVPGNLLEPAGEALGARANLHRISFRVVFGDEPHAEDLPAQARPLVHQPQPAVAPALGFVVAQADELVALHRQRVGKAAPLAHALVVGTPGGIAADQDLIGVAHPLRVEGGLTIMVSP